MSDTTKLAMPTVHLNGTDGTVLYTQIAAAYNALLVAIEALSNATPHSRDYYVQTSTAYRVAAEQHAARVTRLTGVCDELREITCDIQRQNAARAARRGA